MGLWSLRLPLAYCHRSGVVIAILYSLLYLSIYMDGQDGIKIVRGFKHVNNIEMECFSFFFFFFSFFV